MIYKILFIVSLFSILANAQPVNSDDISDDLARDILCSVLSNLDTKNGNGIWPEYNPLESPMIIKFRDNTFGYGEPSAFKDWNEEKKEKCTFYSAPKTFKMPVSPIVPYLDFNGTKAFFFDTTIKPKLSVWLLSAIIHERFHRFQWEHFPNMFTLANSAYSGHNSRDNVAEGLLENNRLISYLQTHTEKNWKDFLSVALNRELGLSKESKDWELEQQISEGTAIYVQLKAFEVIEKEFGIRFRKIWTQKMIGNLDNSEGVDGIIKWRHYALGSLICDYLDRHSSNESWKVLLQTENSSSLFRHVLIGFDEQSLIMNGQEIIKSFEGDQARILATELISEYISEINRVADQINSSKIQVSILNSSKDCSGGGFSEKTYYLTDGGTFGVNYSGSYQCGSNFQEIYTKIPVLAKSKNSSLFGLSEIQIWIDSSEIQIRNGEFKFKNIEIKSQIFSLKASQTGVVVINNSQISIMFDN
ncbi:MAG: hypothetical protein JNL11_10890 [Bdellovibrionaceae bacterium]|nr:hypothetical protein [Pseudobdellovibrionaceae bacterium]